MKKIGISKCLLGENVRYDGSNKYSEQLVKLLKNEKLIPICPESLVFDIPHKPIEIKGNQILMSDKTDVSQTLLKSAKNCLNELLECDFVILKSKSPTCGYGLIYDGTFSNKLIQGNGVLTNLLLQNNIKVFNELQIDEIKKQLELL